MCHELIYLCFNNKIEKKIQFFIKFQQTTLPLSDKIFINNLSTVTHRFGGAWIRTETYSDFFLQQI